MKLSWSHKLFLSVNRFVGRHPRIDRLMILSAHWLIYLIYLALTLWFFRILTIGDPDQALALLLVGLKSSILALLISYAIGLLFPHRRPIRELPQIKELLIPFGTWKSFPSDHTVLSTIAPAALFAVGGPLWFVIVLGLCAILVGVGRVYVGVHYPRDILGGLALALLCVTCIVYYG